MAALNKLWVGESVEGRAHTVAGKPARYPKGDFEAFNEKEKDRPLQKLG
jgi:hypothetical protein